MLEHEPHGFHVVGGVPPIPSGLQVAQVKPFLKPHLDTACSTGDLPGYEGFTAPLRFVVEEDAVADEKAVRFAVVAGIPIGGDFGRRVGASRVKGRVFRLGRGGRTVGKEFR